MAKTTKQVRLTKGERAIREALTSQGRPLPGTPEDRAWIRGRDYGEKRVTDHSAPVAPVTRELYESFGEGISKVDRIFALLCGASATIKQQATFEEESDLIYAVYLIEAAEERLQEVREILDVGILGAEGAAHGD